MQKLLIRIFILVLVTTSCRTIPKISPFVEASSQMRKSMSTGMNAVDNSLVMNELSATETIDKEMANASKEALASLSKDKKWLEALSQTIDKSLLGITSYASAITNLAESGRTGSKDALQVTDPLKEIADQLAPKPISEIIGLTAEVFARINGQIAEARAAKKLEDIMDKSSPTLIDYNTYLTKMIDELLKYNEELYKAKRQILLSPSSLNTSVIDYQKELDKEYIASIIELSIILSYKTAKDVSKKDILKVLMNDFSIKSEKDIEPRQTELIMLSKRIEDEKIRILPLVEKVKKQLTKYKEEFVNTNLLFKKSKDAINVWTKTHADIRSQLNERKPLPNFQELNEIINDLKVIREKIKSLNP